MRRTQVRAGFQPVPLSWKFLVNFQVRYGSDVGCVAQPDNSQVLTSSLIALPAPHRLQDPLGSWVRVELRVDANGPTACLTENSPCGLSNRLEDFVIHRLAICENSLRLQFTTLFRSDLRSQVAIPRQFLTRHDSLIGVSSGLSPQVMPTNAAGSVMRALTFQGTSPSYDGEGDTNGVAPVSGSGRRREEKRELVRWRHPLRRSVLKNVRQPCWRSLARRNSSRSESIVVREVRRGLNQARDLPTLSQSGSYLETREFECNQEATLEAADGEEAMRIPASESIPTVVQRACGHPRSGFLTMSSLLRVPPCFIGPRQALRLIG